MNQQLWNEFLSGKTVVNCRSEEQAKKFIKICMDKGLKWCGKRPVKAHYTIWEVYKVNTYYGMDEDGLCYGTYDGFCRLNKKKCKKVTYKQLMQPDKPAEFTSESKQYKGWEILKLIEEGELKEGDIIYWHNGANSVQEKCEIGAIGAIIFNRTGHTIDSAYLLHSVAQSYFTIGEGKHYLTFDEARKTSKDFKYKDWPIYNPLNRVLEYLKNGFPVEAINQMLDEKAWLVKE